MSRTNLVCVPVVLRSNMPIDADVLSARLSPAYWPRHGNVGTVLAMRVIYVAIPPCHRPRALPVIVWNSRSPSHASKWHTPGKAPSCR